MEEMVNTASTKGTEYLIAVIFLVIFIIALKLLWTPGKSNV